MFLQLYSIRWTEMLRIFVVIMMTVISLHADSWYDDYYAVRIPVEIMATEAGQQIVEIHPADVTEWINETAEFPFECQSFAHDNIRLISSDGMELDGAFRVWRGEELIINGGFEVIENGLPAGWKFSTKEGYSVIPDENGHVLSVKGEDRHACYQMISLATNTWYCFSYRSKGHLGPAPHIFTSPKNGWTVVERSFYDPVITFTNWREISYFFYTDDKSVWSDNHFSVRLERFTGQADNISLRECRMDFVANIPTSGRHRYMLYYSPVEGPLPAPPSRKIDMLPKQSAKIERKGPVQWLDDSLSRVVEVSPQGDLWWIPTTRKLKVDAPAPALKASEILVSCALNESEPFQIVFKPKVKGRIEAVQVRLIAPGGAEMAASCFDIRRAHYIPIHEPSPYENGRMRRPSRFAFTGLLPDPLPAFKAMDIGPDDPPALLWIDISVPVDAEPGKYTGTVTVKTDKTDLIVPLRLQVWDFALPDQPTCRTAFGINYYAFTPHFPYHKVETKADKYTLCRKYFATALRYKISPKGAAGGYGYAVEKPINWHDKATLISAYETELPRFMDELNATSLLIAHWSGPVLSRAETDAGAAKEADRLETIAAMLEKHGWLDRAFVWIDEPRPNAYVMLNKWVAALKAQPHARKLKIFPLVYNGDAYNGLGDVADMMAFWDSEYPASLFSPRYARSPDKKFEPWSYFTRCSQLWIDTPGINNRFWAPKVWAMGGKGIAIWSIMRWWESANCPHTFHNPWENPMVTWGNGALSFFYPPSPLGKNLPEKDMTIVPSLRLLLTRDGIEDFEYGAILERLVESRKAQGLPTKEAEDAIAELRCPFNSPVHWNLSRTYWRNARCHAAQTIMKFKK